jgi:hypothetical protein
MASADGVVLVIRKEFGSKQNSTFKPFKIGLNLSIELNSNETNWVLKTRVQTVVGGVYRRGTGEHRRQSTTNANN